MAFGLPVSLVLHAALLVWAIFVATTQPLPKTPEDVPVEVALISVKDFETRQKKGDADAKQAESAPQPKPSEIVAKQEAPKPKPPTPAPPPPPAAAEPPPPPPADPIAAKIAALPEPAPEPPKPPEPKKAEPPPPPEKDPIAEALALEQARQKAAAEAKAKADAEARAAAEAKARKDAADKKKRDDTEKKRLADLKAAADLKKKQDDAKKAVPFDQQIAAAIGKSEDAQPKANIDKDPTKRGAPPPPSDAASTAKTKGPSAGTKDGKDNRLTAREEDMLKGMIKTALAKCWRVPGGGGVGETPVVTVKWQLRPDGTLSGEPKVVDRIASPAAQAAADAAIRAVIVCAPFSLPADKYSAWREITWEFDPRSVL